MSLQAENVQQGRHHESPSSPLSVLGEEKKNEHTQNPMPQWKTSIPQNARPFFLSQYERLSLAAMIYFYQCFPIDSNKIQHHQISDICVNQLGVSGHH